MVVNVEANLLAKRARVRKERGGPLKDEASSSDLKIDGLAKGMEKLMDRIENIERKPHWDNQQTPPVRNPNFRKNQNPNVGRASPDHNIRPPFHENYAEASTSTEQVEDTHINLMGLKSEQKVFLTQEDQDDHDIDQF